MGFKEFLREAKGLAEAFVDVSKQEAEKDKTRLMSNVEKVKSGVGSVSLTKSDKPLISGSAMRLTNLIDGVESRVDSTLETRSRKIDLSGDLSGYKDYEILTQKYCEALYNHYKDSIRTCIDTIFRDIPDWETTNESMFIDVLLTNRNGELLMGQACQGRGSISTVRILGEDRSFVGGTSFTKTDLESGEVVPVFLKGKSVKRILHVPDHQQNIAQYQGKVIVKFLEEFIQY